MTSLPAVRRDRGLLELKVIWTFRAEGLFLDEPMFDISGSLNTPAGSESRRV